MLTIREANAFNPQLEVAAAPHATPCLGHGHGCRGRGVPRQRDQVAGEHGFNHLKWHSFPGNHL